MDHQQPQLALSAAESSYQAIEAATQAILQQAHPGPEPLQASRIMARNEETDSSVDEA
jgi:hypothetical protein